MNQRLQILQIFNRYLHYGGEEGCVNLIDRELKQFHDMDLYDPSTEDFLNQSIIQKVFLPLFTLHNPSTAFDLTKLQKVNRYHLWQFHNIFPAISPSAYSTAFKLGVPVVHYLHNYKFACPTGFMFAQGREYREGLRGNFLPAICDAVWHKSRLKTAVMAAAILRARQMGVFKKVTQWVAISHAQKAISVEMGIPAENISVIHHFLETPAEKPQALEPDGYALFIGRLSPEKGINQLIEAWRQLGKNRKLVIAGDGPEYANAVLKIKQLGLSNIELRGFVEKNQQADLWKKAAFSIVPSVWQEPFGMVVLESWLHGRPVVAHRIGALPELIRDGESGLLAEPNDPIDLANTIERAFSMSSSQQTEMGRAGFAELSTYYTKSRWIDETNAMYRRTGILA